MSACLDRLQRWFREEHVAYTHQHHRPAMRMADVAQAVHEGGDHVAKAVIAQLPEQQVLLVVPATAHVDFQRVAQRLQAPSARAAHEDEFQHRFPDCELGAMPPFGDLYGLPTYLDEALAHTAQLVFQAGTHRDTLKIATADYVRLARPIIAPLTLHPEMV